MHMKKSVSSESVEPSVYVSFKNRSDTQSSLAMAQERLNALNDDYHYLSADMNPHSDTHPYEEVTLFSIDTRPTDRASAIVQSRSYDLAHDPRLEFSKDHIDNRRIILSQTALGVALRGNKPEFMTSYMNKNHAVWAHPLFADGKQTAAIQLAFTLNQNPRWNYPGNTEVEKIFKSHQEPLNEVAQALAELSLKTSSLSKSLEIQPPTTPDSFVISWDVINSSYNVLSNRYAIHEAYLEAWKAEREKITKSYDTTVLDRGDGEHIVIPIQADLNNPDSVKLFGKQTLPPLIEELRAVHAVVARAYGPAIFPKIALRVGIGNFENNQSNLPTSQAITETVKLAHYDPTTLTAYTPQARAILLPE
jgi:hypothetical protein